MDLSIRSQWLANDSHELSTSLQGQNLVVFLEITGRPRREREDSHGLALGSGPSLRPLLCTASRVHTA